MKTPDSLTRLSAVELSELIRSREVSCLEVMTQYLDRIDGVIDYTFSENFTETDACTDFTGGDFSDIPLCWF